MDSVIIFRATPKQKAEVVDLIKNRLTNISTLAIGDGANDVNMITSAHVGVGIIGEEGKQAARASDYSIAQFSYLKRLLLVHGREAYRKNTFIVCYNFYKNCLFVIPQFWFGIYSLFSGQTLYDPWIYQLYNILFTSLPIIWFGIYDLESDHEFLETSDKHYTQGLIGKLFHPIRFWKWVLTGTLQGLILFVFYFFSFNGIDEDGKSQNLWSVGSMIYFGIILAANLRLLYTTNNHTWISFSLIFISIFSYFVVLFIMSLFKNFENLNNFLMIVNSSKFYFVTLLSLVLIYIVDLGIGKLLLLYGYIKDPLKIEKNHVQEFNKISLNKKQDKFLNEIEIKDQYKKVNDEES
jgi:phospholipid-transporting ATPase